MRVREDAVQKRGLAGAEIAGEDRDGDLSDIGRFQSQIAKIMPATAGMTKAGQLDKAALKALILCLIMSM